MRTSYARGQSHKGAERAGGGFGLCILQKLYIPQKYFVHRLELNMLGSALVRRFVDAVTPLEGRFSGAGKAAFDSFKNRSDLVAAELNAALAGIVQGQGGMNPAFQQGDLAAGDNARQSEGSANFDGARFQGRA